MAEQPLVDRHAHLGALDLTAVRLAPQLPGELADLGDGLGRDGLTEAGQPAAGVDGYAAAQGGVPVVEEPLRFARLAQPAVLVPVELEGGRQVVPLGAVELGGA